MYYWLLIILLQAINCSHKLYILSPSNLTAKLGKSWVTLYSSAFGYTPKGVNVNGIVAFSTPLDACTQIENKQHSQSSLHTFYLADSSNCAISMKANNIFKANGYAAIITKDSNTPIQKHGSKVSMPVLEISAEEAKILTEFLQQNPDVPIVSSIHFSNPAHKPTKGDVDVTLWMSSTDKETYTFLQKFKQFYNPQTKKIFFQPRYVLDSKGSNKTGYHIGCLSSGKYCAPQLEYHSRIEGKQVVEEDLRQILIYENYPVHWWNYVLSWKLDCLSNQNVFSETGFTELCSNFSMVKTGIDPEKIKSLFIQSFRGPKIQIEDNQILLAQFAEQQTFNIQSSPKLYISNRAYSKKTSLSQNLQDIKLSICEAQSPHFSPTCKELNSVYYQDDDGQFWIISLTIVLLIFLMIILVIIYNCIMKRRMKQQVQEQVDRVLEQYYTYEGAIRMQNI